MTIEEAREKLAKEGLSHELVREVLPDQSAPPALLDSIAEAERVGYLDQATKQLKELAAFVASSTAHGQLAAYLQTGFAFLLKMYPLMMAQAMGDMVMNGARYDTAYKEYRQAKIEFKDKARAVLGLLSDAKDAALLKLEGQFLAQLEDWEEIRWVTIDEHRKFDLIKARYVERVAELQPTITAPTIDERLIPTMPAIQAWASRR